MNLLCPKLVTIGLRAVFDEICQPRDTNVSIINPSKFKDVLASKNELVSMI